MDIASTAIGQLMSTARIVLDVAEVRRAGGGSVLADIWLQVDGTDFPATGWEDFVVSVLSWWVDVSLRILETNSGPEVVHFLDGPYLVKIDPTTAGMWRMNLIESRRSGELTVAAATVDPKPLLESLVAATEMILAICRERQWENRESIGLAGTVSDLRDAIGPPPGAIETKQVRSMLLNVLPSFQATLSEFLGHWVLEEPPGICLELAEFGRYVAELVADGNLDDASAGLAAIEQLLQDGTRQVKDAASTCALEALDGHAAAAGLDPRKWGSLLPPAAKAFLSDWHGDTRRYD